VLAASFSVPPNSRQSAVVHLNAQEQPTLTVYPDDVADVPMGDARLVVRHTAAAPPVDVLVDQQLVMTGVAPEAEVAQLVAAGSHVVGAATDGRPLVAAQQTNFAEGSSTVLYLVGSAQQDNLTWLVEVVPGVAVAPTVIRSGDSGLRDARSFPYLAVALLASLVIVTAALAVRARFASPRRAPRRAASACAAFACVAAMVFAIASLARPDPTGSVRGEARSTPIGKLVSLPAPKVGVPLYASSATRLARLGEAEDARARPVELRIDGSNIDAGVVSTGADPRTQEMILPTDASQVAWYAPGVSPGEPGSAVLAAHVDRAGRRGAFFDLQEVRVGARVVVDLSDGTQRYFTVVERRVFPKAQMPSDEIFGRGGPPTLVLVTCGGPFDRSRRTYEDNVALYAVASALPG
jgi:hypothetical protein